MLSRRQFPRGFSGLKREVICGSIEKEGGSALARGSAERGTARRVREETRRAWSKAADRANDNGRVVAPRAAGGEEVVDFVHAAEHLNVAMGRGAYGDRSVEGPQPASRPAPRLGGGRGGLGTVIPSLIPPLRQAPGEQARRDGARLLP